MRRPERAVPPTEADGVLRIEDGCFVRSDTRILKTIDWTIRAGERWVIMGPNGAGKTTLLRIASTYEGLSSGTCTVLGYRIGTVDVRELRRRIGLVSGSLREAIPPRTRAVDLVVMGRDAKLMRWHDEYAAPDMERARSLLTHFGCAGLEEAPFAFLSEGERQRVLLARATMTAPDLLLLDEPVAGLDVVGREQFVASLSSLAAGTTPTGIAIVTHHPEEVPPRFTHALLLRAGEVVASGPLEETVTSATVSDCFSTDLRVDRHHGRFTVRLAG